MSAPLPRPNVRMVGKPRPHPYRKTFTPGGAWCIHPVARGRTCGQPENHPLHQPTQKPAPKAR